MEKHMREASLMEKNTVSGLMCGEIHQATKVGMRTTRKKDMESLRVETEKSLKDSGWMGKEKEEEY